MNDLKYIEKFCKTGEQFHLGYGLSSQAIIILLYLSCRAVLKPKLTTVIQSYFSMYNSDYLCFLSITKPVIPEKYILYAPDRCYSVELSYLYKRLKIISDTINKITGSVANPMNVKYVIVLSVTDFNSSDFYILQLLYPFLHYKPLFIIANIHDLEKFRKYYSYDKDINFIFTLNETRKIQTDLPINESFILFPEIKGKEIVCTERRYLENINKMFLPEIMASPPPASPEDITESQIRKDIEAPAETFPHLNPEIANAPGSLFEID